MAHPNAGKLFLISGGIVAGAYAAYVYKQNMDYKGATGKSISISKLHSQDEKTVSSSSINLVEDKSEGQGWFGMGEAETTQNAEQCPPSHYKRIHKPCSAISNVSNETDDADEKAQEKRSFIDDVFGSAEAERDKTIIEKIKNYLGLKRRNGEDSTWFGKCKEEGGSWFGKKSEDEGSWFNWFGGQEKDKSWFNSQEDTEKDGKGWFSKEEKEEGWFGSGDAEDNKDKAEEKNLPWIGKSEKEDDKPWFGGKDEESNKQWFGKKEENEDQGWFGNKDEETEDKTWFGSKSKDEDGSWFGTKEKEDEGSWFGADDEGKNNSWFGEKKEEDSSWFGGKETEENSSWFGSSEDAETAKNAISEKVEKSKKWLSEQGEEAKQLLQGKKSDDVSNESQNRFGEERDDKKEKTSFFAKDTKVESQSIGKKSWFGKANGNGTAVIKDAPSPVGISQEIDDERAGKMVIEASAINNYHLEKENGSVPKESSINSTKPSFFGKNKKSKRKGDSSCPCDSET